MRVGDVTQIAATEVLGVNNEQQNLANLVQFSTTSDTPTTVDLELVFDISGSMALPADVSPPPTRMDALRFSATTVFNILNAYSLPGDNVGSVYFSTKADPDASSTPTPCAATFGTVLKPADTPSNVTDIVTKLGHVGPTAMTSIGAGLRSAKVCGFDGDTSTNKKEVLLFTDGDQNTPPNVQVLSAAVAPPAGKIQISDDTGNNFADYGSDIQVCTVTAGVLIPAAENLQQNIADATCNRHYVHVRATDQTAQADLETFFTQSLADMLPTDKLEVVVDRTGTISRGQVSIEKFVVAANDTRVSIALSWSGGSGNELFLPLQLRAPNGALVDLNGRTTSGRNSSFITILFPLFQAGIQTMQKGEWNLELNGQKLQSPSVSYHLMVVADNPTLVSKFTIDVADVGTGDAIPIRVNLTDDGLPILNATVQAQLMGPAISQGTMLSTAPTPNLPSTADKAGTKGQAKLEALYQNPNNASLFANTSLPTLSLLDNGNQDNGDIKANDGVYSGVFKNTSNEGHYYFAVRVRGTSATAGDFQRAYLISRFVRSKPDAGKTVFKVLSLTAADKRAVLVTLQAIPHDHFGNFLGPGYQNAMQINSSQGTVVNALDDKLDGSYEITYRLPSASSNPTFTIVILGQPVVAKTLNQMKPGKWAAYFDLGAGFPHGTFSNAFNTGFSLNAGLEYMINSYVSAEVIFGYHHFPGKIVGNLNTYQFSGNAKVYLLPPQKLRPFANGGIGAYKFSPGSTNFGGNFGGGVLFELTSRWGIQGSYNFHAVNTAGGATKFSTLQGGVRFVF